MAASEFSLTSRQRIQYNSDASKCWELRIRALVGATYECRVQMIVFSRRRPRRWQLFVMFLLLYVLSLFFIGLEQWELWAMALIIIWVRWCLRTQ